MITKKKNQAQTYVDLDKVVNMYTAIEINPENNLPFRNGKNNDMAKQILVKLQ